MKDYLAILLTKLKAVLKPAIWSFIPALVGQIQVAIKERDLAKIVAIADRLEATAVEEREHANALDALASHLKQMVADNKIDGIEAAEALDLIQTVLDESEDVATGKDEDDVPPAGAVAAAGAAKTPKPKS
jgi:hypothetical protein